MSVTWQTNLYTQITADKTPSFYSNHEGLKPASLQSSSDEVYFYSLFGEDFVNLL